MVRTPEDLLISESLSAKDAYVYSASRQNPYGATWLTRASGLAAACWRWCRKTCLYR